MARDVRTEDCEEERRDGSLVRSRVREQTYQR